MTSHANVPHCDTVTSTPEEKLFWESMHANKKYQQLVKEERMEKERLADTQRWLGRTVFNMFDHIASIKDKQESIKNIKAEIRKIFDETQIQSLKGSAKSEVN